MHIKIRPSFIVYLLCIALLSNYTNCLSIMLTLLVHEACHYVACRFVGEQIEQIELTPYGGIMTYKQGSIPQKGFKGIIVHAAGPLGNYLFLLSLCLPRVQCYISSDLLRSLLLANGSMLLLNLLPVFPLDGGHIFFCMGYYVFPVAKLIRTLSSLGAAVGICGISLVVYGFLFHQRINCSLLIVSLHLCICARNEQKALLTENVFAVIHERLSEVSRIQRIEHYLVRQNEPLLNLIPNLREGVRVSFFFSDRHELLELTEYTFCQALLEMPSATVKEAYLRFSQAYKKAKEGLKTP